MTNTDIVHSFFMEGYENKTYDLVMSYLSNDYIDHSPAGARGNSQAVEILKIVESWGNWPDKEIEKNFDRFRI